jgi:uncharacterized protein YdaU (DUF1376 family)
MMRLAQCLLLHLHMLAAVGLFTTLVTSAGLRKQWSSTGGIGTGLRRPRMARKPDSHHVLPLFCDDLIASCVDMTPACFGAYMRLLCYAWTRGGIPDDEGACGRIAGGLEPGDWAAIRSRLVQIADGSHCDRTAIANGSQTDVRLTHPRLELERQAVEAHKQKKSEAGKKGNDARWGSQTDRKPIAEGVANGSQTDRKRIAPNPSPSLPVKDIQTPSESVATSDPPRRRKRSQHHDAVSWSADAGWHGITDADRSEWSKAFPGALLDQELAKATAWLHANPERAGKRKWRAFIVRWLGKCQERGGTNRTPGNRPEDRPPPKAWKDEYRPAQYRTPKEVAALAAGLKLTEEN